MATSGGGGNPPGPKNGPNGGKKPSKNVEKYFGSEVDLKMKGILNPKQDGDKPKVGFFGKKPSRDVTHPDSMKEMESKLKAVSMFEKKPPKDDGKEEEIGKQVAKDLIGQLAVGKPDEAKKSAAAATAKSKEVRET